MRLSYTQAKALEHLREEWNEHGLAIEATALMQATGVSLASLYWLSDEGMILLAEGRHPSGGSALYARLATYGDWVLSVAEVDEPEAPAVSMPQTPTPGWCPPA